MARGYAKNRRFQRRWLRDRRKEVLRIKGVARLRGGLSRQGSEQMDDAPIPLDLRRKKAEKRGPSDVEDLIASHLNSVDMTDAVDVNRLAMGRLEVEEKKTVQVATDE